MLIYSKAFQTPSIEISNQTNGERLSLLHVGKAQKPSTEKPHDQSKVHPHRRFSFRQTHQSRTRSPRPHGHLARQASALHARKYLQDLPPKVGNYAIALRD